jgi:hypothetical protein
MRIMILPFLLASLAYPAIAQSQPDFTTLCLDVGTNPCTDRYLPFRGTTVNLCDKTCTFSAPVRVIDMEATLYKVQCTAGAPDSRAMIISQSGHDGLHKTFVIGDGSVPTLGGHGRMGVELLNCPPKK